MGNDRKDQIFEIFFKSRLSKFLRSGLLSISIEKICKQDCKHTHKAIKINNPIKHI
jgi:hypothetical protein